MTVNESLAVVMRINRRSRKIKRTELSRMIGLSNQQINQIESFAIGAKLETIFKLANAFGVQAEDLVQQIRITMAEDIEDYLTDGRLYDGTRPSYKRGEYRKK